MTVREAQTLYRKVGRRYVPHCIHWSDDRVLPVGTFRLVYAYTDGGRRYEYDVTPDTAGWAAAAMVAKHAIREAVISASRPAPIEPAAAKPYTKRQLQAIDTARSVLAEAGVGMPSWWGYVTPDDLADTAIAAVQNYRP